MGGGGEGRQSTELIVWLSSLFLAMTEEAGIALHVTDSDVLIIMVQEVGGEPVSVRQPRPAARRKECFGKPAGCNCQRGAMGRSWRSWKEGVPCCTTTSTSNQTSWQAPWRRKWPDRTEFDTAFSGESR